MNERKDEEIALLKKVLRSLSDRDIKTNDENISLKYKLSKAIAILKEVAMYGPEQEEKSSGIACACCDMGDAGYSTRGSGFHDDSCVVKDAQVFFKFIIGEEK